MITQEELGLSNPLKTGWFWMLSPDILVFLHFFLAEPHFSVGSPFFDVLEKVDMSAVFHFHAPLPLHKSAVYSMSKFIYGVGGGYCLK